MFKNFKMTFDYRFVENDDVVVCFVSPKRVDDELMRYWTLAGIIKEEIPNSYKNVLVGEVEFKGIARYKSGDINDKELAREIARSKAVRRAFKEYRNVAQYCFDIITKEAIDNCGFIDSIDKKINKVQEEITEYTRCD